MPQRHTPSWLHLGSCCGNKFIIVDTHHKKMTHTEMSAFAHKYIPCYKVDSALFLERSKQAEVFMRIFEQDGSESESCGNGAILIAHLLKLDNGRIETRSGPIKVQTKRDKEAILAYLEVADVSNHLAHDGYVYVKIGEPHAVYVTENSISKFPLRRYGQAAQKRHKQGVNVDVIKKIDARTYHIRTYERGVFAETKSCGTGSLASFVTVYFLNSLKPGQAIEFKSRGGQHWVSKEHRLYKLETLKKYIKVKPFKI